MLYQLSMLGDRLCLRKGDVDFGDKSGSLSPDVHDVEKVVMMKVNATSDPFITSVI